MRLRPSGITRAAVLAVSLLPAANARAAPYQERPAPLRAVYTGIAVVANVVPIVSALYAPQCLPGYVLCKFSFAGMSLLLAADQLALSGGADLEQTRGILYRGFAGDWFLTGRHIAGEVEPRPLPDPPPPSSGAGGWQPPPR